RASSGRRMSIGFTYSQPLASAAALSAALNAAMRAPSTARSAASSRKAPPCGEAGSQLISGSALLTIWNETMFAASGLGVPSGGTGEQLLFTGLPLKRPAASRERKKDAPG